MCDVNINQSRFLISKCKVVKTVFGDRQICVLPKLSPRTGEAGGARESNPAVTFNQ